MVERRDEVVVDRRPVESDRSAGGGTTAVAWIALVAALLALALAWMAYNRTGENLEDRIQDAVNQSAQSVEEATRNDGEPTAPANQSPGTTDQDFDNQNDVDTTRPDGTTSDQTVPNQ